MTITSRDRRALIVLGAAVVVALAVSFWPEDSAGTDVVGVSDAAGTSVERLERVKQLAAQVPGKQKQLDALTADLGQWDSGMIEAETGQQAQAEMLQVLRRVSSRFQPPLEFGSEEFGQIRALGETQEYGEALVTVSFDCAVEELVNLKEKILRVRLTIAGLIPHSLVPDQRGLATF